MITTFLSPTGSSICLLFWFLNPFCLAENANFTNSDTPLLTVIIGNKNIINKKWEIQNQKTENKVKQSNEVLSKASKIQN